MAVIVAIVSGLLLGGVSLVSYGVLARWLDANATTRLRELTDGLQQFSAALAHELRTPLAALRGEIELALRGAARQPTTQAVLGSQIEEIDRLTRAESGQTPLTFAAVDLGELAASLVEQLEPVVQARSITLSCERSDHAVAKRDAGWLERPAAEPARQRVEVHAGRRACCRTRRPRSRTSSVDVVDNGLGMLPEVSARVHCAAAGCLRGG